MYTDSFTILNDEVIILLLFQLIKKIIIISVFKNTHQEEAMKKLIVSFSAIFALALLAPPILFESDAANFSSIYAQTKDQCTEQLDKAEEEYQAGNGLKRLELIEQCLKKENVGELERGRAYRILGLVYIAIQLEKEANDAVKNLLIMVPNYKVDPVKDPPSLQKIIDNMASDTKS